MDYYSELDLMLACEFIDERFRKFKVININGNISVFFLKFRLELA